MRLLASLFAIALVAVGCAKPSTNEGFTVVTAFYPLAYAAEQLEGVNVVNLTPAGVEPHDFELSAADVELIASADLVVYIPGFQPALDEAIAQQAPQTSLNALDGLSLITDPDGVTDPHVWLDPMNEAAIASNIANRVAELQPGKSATYAAHAAEFTSRMQTLNEQFTSELRNCTTRTMVVSHDAFGYLASAYQLTQVGVSGLSPDAEPSPARLAEVAQIVADQGVHTIYYETLVDPKIATTLAATTGATAAVLDPIEGLVVGSDQNYESLMTSNLATLKKGQGCT